MLLLSYRKREQSYKAETRDATLFRAQRPALFFDAQNFWAQLFIPSLNELASVPSMPSRIREELLYVDFSIAEQRERREEEDVEGLDVGKVLGRWAARLSFGLRMKSCARA